MEVEVVAVVGTVILEVVEMGDEEGGILEVAVGEVVTSVVDVVEAISVVAEVVVVVEEEVEILILENVAR